MPRGAVEGGPWRGTRSPWKDRVPRFRQRDWSTTDSSMEQGLEVGCSVTDLAGTAHQQWTPDRPGESSPSPGAPRCQGRMQREAAPRDGVDLVHDSRVSLTRAALGSRRVAEDDPRVGVSGLPPGGREARCRRARACLSRSERATAGGPTAGRERGGLGHWTPPGRDARVRGGMPLGVPDTSVSTAILRREEAPPPPPGGCGVNGNGRRARGRGDAVRLSAREPSKGESRVAGKTRRVQTTSGWAGPAGRKRDEPHGR